MGSDLHTDDKHHAYAVCGGQKRSVIAVYDALSLRSEMADCVHS